MATEFYTKIAGVNFQNTGANTENRQIIIRQLLMSHRLAPGQELSLEPEFSNPYDCNAIKVMGPDGRQLGYLSRQVAGHLAPQIRQGQSYKARVASVTGGSDGYMYGVNISIVDLGTAGQTDSSAKSERTYRVAKNTESFPMTPAEEAAERELLVDKPLRKDNDKKYKDTNVEIPQETLATRKQMGENLLVGAVVKNYDSGKEYVISKVEGKEILFANGRCVAGVGDFLRYYKFIDWGKRDVFEELFCKEISDFHAKLERNSPRPASDWDYTPPSDEDYDSFYEEEADWGPDSLSDSYDDYHSYD